MITTGGGSWDRQRTSFGELAGDYDATRPGWPAATAAWLTGTAAAAGRKLDVLDLGAGTGKLTGTLVEAGHRVTAADPSEGMIAVLVASFPDARAEVAAAEDLPFDDDSFDVVTVAQAWHWVRPHEAASECARVLRPGGLLAVGWHLRSTAAPWVRELEEIAGRPSYATRTGETRTGETRTGETRTGDTQTRDTTDAKTVPGKWMDVQMARDGLGEAFGPVEAAVFDYRLRLSPAGLARLASSWSYVSIRADRDDVLARVEALGRRVAVEEAAADGLLTLPYLTHCYRATLRA